MDFSLPPHPKRIGVAKRAFKTSVTCCRHCENQMTRAGEGVNLLPTDERWPTVLMMAKVTDSTEKSV